MERKILIVLVPAFDPNSGGVQMSTFKLAKFFASKGLAVSIFSFESEGHIQPDFATLYHAQHKGVNYTKENVVYCSEVVGQVDVVIENLKRMKSTPKIILSVRNQVKRIESTYLQRVKVGKIEANAEQTIDVTIPGVLNRGKFGSVLAKYIEAFSQESVLVVNFDLLIQKNSNELIKVKQFLNLEEDLSNTLPESNPSVGGAKKHWLLKFYKRYLSEFWRNSKLPSLKKVLPYIEKTSNKIEQQDIARLTPSQVDFLIDFNKEDETLFR